VVGMLETEGDSSGEAVDAGTACDGVVTPIDVLELLKLDLL